MAQRGGLQSVDPEQLEPFGRLVYDYLLSFRPNKTVNEFAAQCNVSGQAVWDWIHGNTTPRRASIMLIASATDLPLNDLLQAAGLPTDIEKAGARRQNRKVAEEILDYLRQELSAKFSPEDMRAIDAYLADGLRDYLNGEEPKQPTISLPQPEKEEHEPTPQQPARTRR